MNNKGYMLLEVLIAGVVAGIIMLSMFKAFTIQFKLAKKLEVSAAAAAPSLGTCAVDEPCLSKAILCSLGNKITVCTAAKPCLFDAKKTLWMRDNKACTEGVVVVE